MAPENDMAERMVRVETKLDILLAQVDKLPPSPVCVVKHKEVDQRFEAVDKRFGMIEKWQNRLAGALIAANVLLILAMEKIRAFFFGP